MLLTSHDCREGGVTTTPSRAAGLAPYHRLDEPLHVTQHVDPRRPAGLYDSLLGGLHTAPALIRHDGSRSGIQVLVNPLGARILLGLPSGELTGIDLHAADVLGHVATETHERLRLTRTWAERFAVLDQGLIRGVLQRDRAPASDDVSHVWRSLLAAGGARPVGALVRENGWSSTYLSNRFRVEAGLTPKAAARVIRFDRARRILHARVAGAEPPRLAELAAHCGYYDQSHLVCEFQRLAGCSPSQWLAGEFENIQATPAPDEPELAS